MIQSVWLKEHWFCTLSKKVKYFGILVAIFSVIQEYTRADNHVQIWRLIIWMLGIRTWFGINAVQYIPIPCLSSQKTKASIRYPILWSNVI
jgi:hypothetical protein